MRIDEIVASSRAPLYHWLYLDKARVLFKSDIIKAKWDHNLAEFGLGKTLGNSFSRNTHFDWNKPVRITVDQDKLRQTNRIIPLDAERTHALSKRLDNDTVMKGLYGDINLDSYRDRSGKGTSSTTFAEEFVIGDIRNAHRYITEVYVKRLKPHQADDIADSRMGVKFLEAVKAFTDRFGIPLILDKSVEQLPSALYWERTKAEDFIVSLGQYLRDQWDLEIVGDVWDKLYSDNLLELVAHPRHPDANPYWIMEAFRAKGTILEVNEGPTLLVRLRNNKMVQIRIIKPDEVVFPRSVIQAYADQA